MAAVGSPLASNYTIVAEVSQDMAQKKYGPQAKYAKESTVSMAFRFMKNTEPDLIEWMNAQPNKAGYIKRLIRADMARVAQERDKES